MNARTTLLLKNQSIHLVVRFLVVGLLNTAFGYSIFAILIYSGMHYAFSLFFSTVLGILFNFKSMGTIVFKSNNNRLIFRFIAVYALVYAVNVILIKLLSTLGLSPYYSAGVLIIPTATLTFVLNRKFVFNLKHPTKQMRSTTNY